MENKETIEEAMNKNGYHDTKSDKLFREGVEFGVKWQQEHYGLMEIELRHTKALLASCEKALEERDKQQKRSHSDEDIRNAQQAILCNTKDALQDENYIIDYLKQFKKK